MTENNQAKGDFNSSGLITFIYKWRKHLLIVTIIAVILSIFFSSPLFITPKYKATVVMFPTSSNALSKALLIENPASRSDILEFGQEEQAEQLMQILYSNDIRKRIIDKYNLMSHYGIDTTSKYKRTNLYNQYKNNITFRRNEFMAVEINVLDSDPQIASNIANDIASLVDTVKNNIQKNRAKYGLKIVEDEYNALQKDINQMEDSLNSLRKLGVIEYSTQSQMINRQLAMEIARNNKSGIKALEDQLKILADHGGSYIAIMNELGFKRSRLGLLRAKYDEAKVDAEKSIPQKFVIDNAYPPEKKAYPIRWLIVVVSTLSALLISVLLIITFENLKTKQTHN